jgi:cytochrome oxidase Cu insertion factor (SCO1/SenC/PrrC family)
LPAHHGSIAADINRFTPNEHTEVQLLTITTDPEIDSPKAFLLKQH